MSELTIKLPDATTPGYLRRMKQADKYRQGLRDGTIEFDELVEWLLIYVIEPADRDEARETLLDLSKEQYIAVLDAINNPANPT